MNCVRCQKETNNAKFCSKSCSAIYNNTRKPKRKLKKRYCTGCGNELQRQSWRNTRRRCNECHKSEQFFHKTLAEYQEKESVRGKHPSWLNAHVRGLNRSWNKDLTKKPCYLCGYSKHVELCHVKAITSFSKTTTLGEINARENIAPLCRNCHWELDNHLVTIVYPVQHET